jgi:acyl-CoA thioesterase I
MAMSIRPTLCALLAFLLAACSPSTGAPAPASAPDAAPSATGEAGAVRPVIVMLGDSLTAGYGLAPDEALPDQVAAVLKARSVPATLVNAGVSGDTTRGGLERYDWSVKGSGADILVIALGANDFLNGLPAEQAEQNLRAIIEQAKADGLRVALLAVALRAPGGQRDPREAAYAGVYRRLSKDFGLSLAPDMLDAVAGKPALLQADGLHPTAEGVRAMAESLADFVAGEARAWTDAQ